MKILVLQGHPDTSAPHFCHALAQAYAQAAKGGGHEVRTIDVGRLEFPILRSVRDWENGPPPPSIAKAQEEILWASHLVIVFPLWLGDMPALLKAFFEQTFRAGFALGASAPNRLPKKLLKGRSARLIVTMGMPAFFYRLYYRAHSVRSIKRSILELCGISPVRTTLIGTVEKPDKRQLALAAVQGHGRAAR